MLVSIEHISKKFGQTSVLKGVSLEIRDHELFFLLGPSGCGKTTLLRLLAGFYEPDEGQIRFGDQVMNSIPPHRRHTGMVFQNYALWPHMTVAENVAYGLRSRGIGGDECRRRVSEALATVQMEPYDRRTPNQLSGGQQQRIALARALVVRPDVLLLDEPLSNLDAKLRLEMREEIRRIHHSTQITTIYVTHDQKEALSLADRVAVLREGRIEQLGDPRSVYRAPASRFVAEFIGETNWMKAQVRQSDQARVELQTADGVFELPQGGEFEIGREVWLGFRPEAVRLHASSANTLDARIAQRTYLGEIEQYELALKSGRRIKAIEANPAVIREVGEVLQIHVHPSDCFVLGD